MFSKIEQLLTWMFGRSGQASGAVEATRVAAAPFTEVAEVASHMVPYDENLLERSRTQWQFGDWKSLALIGRDVIENHPDRAKLALLAAAGHAQVGDLAAARQFTQLAQDWGCSKKLLAQIMIAGAHNSIGRAAIVAGQTSRANDHFKAALRIGAPAGETRLLADARAMHQIRQLRDAAVSTAPAVTETVAAPVADVAPSQFNEMSYAYYRDAVASGEPRAPFIMLESKSLPRSGLHYMAKTFARVLGEYFSFCELYHERGCCKQMPCAITGFDKHSHATGTARVRLVKSHDFNLNDPTYPPLPNVRRVILIRDPLFLLTSWFALDQFAAYPVELERANLSIEKIFLAHEPEVLAMAHAVIDEVFIPPSPAALAIWLADKKTYVSGFVDKWVAPESAPAVPFQEVVDYEDTDAYIKSVLAEVRGHLPPPIQARIDDFAQNSGLSFHQRGDPFRAPSARVSDFLLANASAFKDTALQIAAADKSGRLRTTASPERVHHA